MGKLDVRIVGAKQLYNQETFGKSDPYCVVSCEGRKYKTTTKPSDLAPVWNEKFTFMIADPNTSQLKIEVFDDNLTSDTPMGHYYVSLSGLTKGKVSDEWYIMQGCKSGQLHVRLLAVDFGLEPTPAQHAAPASAPVPQQQPQQQPVYQQQAFQQPAYAQPPPVGYGYPTQQPQPMYAPPQPPPMYAPPATGTQGPYYPPQPAYPPQVPGQAPFGGPPQYPSDGPSYGVQNPYPPYGAGVGQQPQYPGLGGQPQFPPMNVSQPTV